MGPVETRYARSGDVSIAYQVAGGGSLDLLLIPSWVSQVEHLWTQPLIARMLRRLTSFSRLILFDRRGTGLSDRTHDPPPLEEQMDDVRAVMAAARSERAALVVIETEGTGMATLFAATYPDLVSALVLYAPMPRIVARPDYPWGYDPERREKWIESAVARWGQGVTLDTLAPSWADRAGVKEWFGRLERLAVGPGAVRPILRVVGETDVRDVLSLVRVPTLVLRRRDDPWVDERHAQFVCERIPGAKYVELPGDENLIFAGDTEAVLEELEEFLTGTRHRAEPERVLATVLFTDIVSSTAQAAGLGDRRWGELLEDHRAVVRRELERFGGREVKTLGDGFLLTFDGPARAVRCALAAIEASREIGIEVRAGLHTGECERAGDDIGGIGVHIAARVLAHAGAGEVLVSRTVTDLVAGSGLSFAGRGVHELRGVPGEWQLFSASG